jgi:hypothetical protein
VQARVLRLTPSEVYVDAGLHSISPVPRSQIDVGHVMSPAPDAPLSERSSLRDLRIGDVIRAAIQDSYTPYGKPLLAGSILPDWHCLVKAADACALV